MSVPDPAFDTQPRAVGPGTPRAGAAPLRPVPIRMPARAAAQVTLAGALELLAGMIPGVRSAFVGLDADGAGGFVVSEARPAGEDSDPALIDAALEALRSDAAVVRDATLSGAVDGTVLAARVTTAGGRSGAVALALDALAARQRETVSRLLEWGAAWLGLVAPAPAAEQVNAPALALETASAGLAQATVRAAATAMAAEVGRAFGCERVSIGLLDGERVRLTALSHGARVDARTEFSRDLVAAMEEAVDEAGCVVLPHPPDAPAQGTRAHERLLRAHALVGISSVLLRDGDRTVGVLTAERSRGAPFDDATRDRLQAVAAPIGAILALKQAATRALLPRAWDALAARAAGILGPGRVVTRVALAALLAAAIALAFTDGDYRVSAPATLEGAVHRSVVAPIDGYVARAPARAGDAVRAGDVLVELDTRELEHARRTTASERAEIEKGYRQAVAALDRPKLRIMKARLGKVDSELALIDAQIERAEVSAPFDGIVVSGDLSHALGAPVARGDVLFELAPLDDYRIVLEVSERDVADVAPGLGGELALAALPGEPLPFVVEKVVGVAETANGRNVFRVEARLEAEGRLLRPGMQGVGKVHVERRRLVWVWTHALVDRVRLWLWSNAP